MRRHSWRGHPCGTFVGFSTTPIQGGGFVLSHGRPSRDCQRHRMFPKPKYRTQASHRRILIERSDIEIDVCGVPDEQLMLVVGKIRQALLHLKCVLALFGLSSPAAVSCREKLIVNLSDSR
jgi:hypothetical protein